MYPIPVVKDMALCGLARNQCHGQNGALNVAGRSMKITAYGALIEARQ